MNLITAPIKKAIEANPLGSKDGQGEDAKVIVKFFGGGRFSFFATEGDFQYDGNGRVEDITFFGWVVSPLGPDCDEWGYLSFRELEATRFPPFGLRVERDRGVTPGRYTVKELK